MNRPIRVVALLQALVLVSTGAEAQRARHRSFSLELYESQSTNRDVSLLAVSHSWGMELTSTLTAGLEPKLVLITGNWAADEGAPAAEDASGLGAGGSTIGRWSPLHVWFLEPYIEVGAGLLLSSTEIPNGGTTWNFWTRWGAGTAFRLNAHALLRLGYGRVHLSNWRDLTGQPLNPGYDGDGVVLALQLATP